MANSVQPSPFITIQHSIEELNNYVGLGSKSNNRFLLLDLDNTLLKYKKSFDENIYVLLKEQNIETEKKIPKFPRFAHYEWITQLRKNVPVKSFGSVEAINNVIKTYQENGWTVLGLTSRNIQQKEETERQLTSLGIELPIEKIIFKQPGPDGKSEKDDCFKHWLSKEVLTKKQTGVMIDVAFIDDSLDYCKVISRLANDINEFASVTCFHFKPGHPNSNLSESYRNRFFNQLYLYDQGMEISFDKKDYSKAELTNALSYYGVEDTSNASIHRAAMQSSLSHGLPSEEEKRGLVSQYVGSFSITVA